VSRYRRPVTPARLTAATEARRLGHALVAADADDATFDAVADLLARANALLAEVPHLPRAPFDPERLARFRRDRERTGVEVMADRAVAGPANPTSVDFTSRIVDGVVEADVVFGPAFEGAPGRAHGGIVAAVFDDLLGTAMAAVEGIGFTGRLTVHYRAPVPVGPAVAFRLETGPQDGRKLHVRGEARLGERLLSEAEALMILVDVERFKVHAGDLHAGDLLAGDLLAGDGAD